MKVSIGDVVDRFTICKLKKERLNIDNQLELESLKYEISNYDDKLNYYIDNLYIVNGEIWNLESDIRKGNEILLGLEEVGRRAIKIREFNQQRIKLKNELNSLYNEGFVEIKMNHGSEIEKSLIISLTTVPERLHLDNEDGLKNVITHLCEQEDYDYEIHFNIPEIYSVTGEKYIIPKWLETFKFKYPHLKIFRTDDLGPPTKFVPTIQRVKNDETIILVVDDDMLYYKDMVSEHRKFQSLYKDSVICYEGRGALNFIYNGDIRDHWILCVTEVREVTSFQHYKTASYKRKLFSNDFFDYYLGKTLSDDVLASRYLKDSGHKIYVVPYEKHNYLFETKELWDINQGVTTFPILRCATSVPNTGCNHVGLLNIQPKFYEPHDLGFKHKKYIEARNFSTDKISHGYLPFYEKYFEDRKECENVLEIGIYQGESLKLLSHYFPNAKIHGIDINYYSDLDSDKIKTYVANQSNITQLDNVVEQIGDSIDIIIDDGSHTMKDQQVSFGHLFKYLKTNGIYIIEDLHTSCPSSFENHKSPDDLISTLEMLNTFINENKLISNYISEEEKNYIEENILSIKIWSRTEDFCSSVTSVIIKK